MKNILYLVLLALALYALYYFFVRRSAASTIVTDSASEPQVSPLAAAPAAPIVTPIITSPSSNVIVYSDSVVGTPQEDLNNGDQCLMNDGKTGIKNGDYCKRTVVRRSYPTYTGTIFYRYPYYNNYYGSSQIFPI